MRNIVLLVLVIISMVACKRKNEPQAFICPENPITITIHDTLELSNCSKNYTRQRWELPSGVTSTQNKIKFWQQTPGAYVVKLFVANDDWANDYYTKSTIIVTE